mmetsp:Transcript_9296/g.8760  ORF Transcript_9296/g.8760 Transcript_9296/m.8760 type:complete len:122 (-) Transcript_9296:255-620(-)
MIYYYQIGYNDGVVLEGQGSFGMPSEPKETDEFYMYCASCSKYYEECKYGFWADIMEILFPKPTHCGISNYLIESPRIKFTDTLKIQLPPTLDLYTELEPYAFVETSFNTYYDIIENGEYS